MEIAAEAPDTGHGDPQQATNGQVAPRRAIMPINNIGRDKLREHQVAGRRSNGPAAIIFIASVDLPARAPFHALEFRHSITNGHRGQHANNDYIVQNVLQYVMESV